MKVRMRFIKRGPLMYIGHLDLMRFFQKVFRRCGLDVAYSQGFNPHQILSFASPLGVGLTSIGEYLDATLNSLNIVNVNNNVLPDDVRIINDEDEVNADCNIQSLTTRQWIDRINKYSNDMVIVTGFNIMPDDIKPSMSLLAAASYAISYADPDMPHKIAEYYNSRREIMYTKVSKKSTSEINLKEGIYVVSESSVDFHDYVCRIAEYDTEYENRYIGMLDCNNLLYIMCAAGSSLNIRPEMLVESYMAAEGIDNIDYDIIRLDMFCNTGDGRYITMSA